MGLELNTTTCPCNKSKNGSSFYTDAVIIFDVGKCEGRVGTKGI